MNEMLDAQSRVSIVDASYYDALVRYMIALKNIHYEKGTLLEYNNIAFVDRIAPTRTIVRTQNSDEVILQDYSVAKEPRNSPKPLPPSREDVPSTQQSTDATKSLDLLPSPSSDNN